MRTVSVDFKVFLSGILVLSLLAGCNRTIANELSTSQNLLRQRREERQQLFQQLRQQLRSEARPGEDALALNPNFVSLKLTHQGRIRDYLLYTPVSYDKTRPYPVVIGFHGGTSTNARFARTTNFQQLADEKQFLVIYPNAVNKNWNDGRGTVNQDIDDVGFVTAIIEEIKRLRNVDAHRIYATGISNGAFLVQRLACERSDLIAAFSSIAGAMPTLIRANCNPARPVSMMMINSPDDRFVPWEGGEGRRGKGGNIMSIMDTLNFWRMRNSCTASFQKTLIAEIPGDKTRVSVINFNNCKSNSEVVLYKINGGGHTWPGGEAQPAWLLGPTSKQINATRLSFDFFQRHSLHR